MKLRDLVGDDLSGLEVIVERFASESLDVGSVWMATIKKSKELFVRELHECTKFKAAVAASEAQFTMSFHPPLKYPWMQNVSAETSAALRHKAKELLNTTLLVEYQKSYDWNDMDTIPAVFRPPLLRNLTFCSVIPCSIIPVLM